MAYLKLTYEPYTLYFKFEAGTSRGVMHERAIWLLSLSNPDSPSVIGRGEVAPLAGLSLDDIAGMEHILSELAQKVAETNFAHTDISGWVRQIVPANLPAVRFGLESALYDLANGGKGIIWQNDFAMGKQRLPTNGLIWMGKPDFMQTQIEEKLQKGFRCLKLKIGALDFEQEIAILKSIRQRYSADEIVLRVDANGAFLPAEALQKLQILASLDIHSIEQPIRAGQTEEMARLCELSPLPIALDEELIPVVDREARARLLQYIKPAFIILKPSLLGGFASCAEWVDLARQQNIHWWVTSALESNIGLNAICQFTAELLASEAHQPCLPQGLGTGGLYHNNLPSPLCMEGEEVFLLT